LNERFASPLSSSAASGAPSRSWAIPSSSKTPTAIVSALVVVGASVVAEARNRAATVRH
jgi:hypothetical protein